MLLFSGYAIDPSVDNMAAEPNLVGDSTKFDDNKGSRWQEDKECFLIAQMECNMHYIDFLFEQGLHYDYNTNSSVDFACVKRYGGAIWEVEWLRYNAAYIWHKDSHKDKVAYAEKINNMKMEDIAEAIERGENIWDTIW